MIGYYHFSMIGRSHLAQNGVCQDANAVDVLENGWVVGVIADGLGSSKHSDIGASLAVGEVVAYIKKNLPPAWHEESLKALLMLGYHSAFNAIETRAKQDKNQLSEYDTTLTTVIYDGRNVVYGHVGDGGIITLDNFGYYSTLTKRQKGDAWNEVAPLRHGPDYWEFGSSRDPICAILMATDGILDAGILPPLLANEDMPIHIGYVRPFMDRNRLKVETETDFIQAQAQIEEYFRSPDTAHITDDKTMVGIINTDVLPSTLDGSYYAEPDWASLKKKQNEGLYPGVSSVPNNEPRNDFVLEPDVFDNLVSSVPNNEPQNDSAKQPSLRKEPRTGSQMPDAHLPESYSVPDAGSDSSGTGGARSRYKPVLILLGVFCIIVALMLAVPPMLDHGNNYPEQLEGNWILTGSVVGFPVDGISLGIHSGNVTGSIRGDNYTGTVIIDTSDRITFGSLGPMEGSGSHRFRYLATLDSITDYQIENGILFLKSDGKTLLTFSRGEPTQKPLSGSWISPDTEVTLNIGENDSFTGEGAASSYTGVIIFTNDSVRFDVANSSKMVTEDPEFFTALVNVTGYTIENDALFLTDKDGTRILTFVPVIENSADKADLVGDGTPAAGNSTDDTVPGQSSPITGNPDNTSETGVSS